MKIGEGRAVVKPIVVYASNALAFRAKWSLAHREKSLVLFCVCCNSQTPNKTERETALRLTLGEQRVLASTPLAWRFSLCYSPMLLFGEIADSPSLQDGLTATWCSHEGFSSTGRCLTGFQDDVSWLTRCSWPWAMGIWTQKGLIGERGLLALLYFTSV